MSATMRTITTDDDKHLMHVVAAADAAVGDVTAGCNLLVVQTAGHQLSTARHNALA